MSQPCGFPDMTQWEKDHPGNIEYCCEYCGIYTAGKPRCNKCQGEEQKPKNNVWVIKKQNDVSIFIPPVTNNSIFPNRGRGKK